MPNFANKIQTHNRGVFTKLNEFQYIQKLGTGSFGSVHLYFHMQQKKKYAIKQILGESIANQYEAEGIEREIRVQMKCNNKHIIQLYDAFYEDDNIYIVLEYVENGNLFQYIQSHAPMSEIEACKYFTQTCLALQYMHQHNIYHRDIKPENLLLDENNDIKLCDFGWCAENINQKRKTFCGTYEYMAPEIVMDIVYDYRIDIWSVGILLYELIHKNAPFKGKDYQEISFNIKLCQPKVRCSVSKEASNMIFRILQVEPNARPSFQQIFSTQFVKRYFPQLSMCEQFQENIQPKSIHNAASGRVLSPVRFMSPKRRITEYNSPILKPYNKQFRVNSPKHEQHPKFGSPPKAYVSPSRKIQPKRREPLNESKLKTGPLDLKGVKDATKIVYMSLCNNIS